MSSSTGPAELNEQLKLTYNQWNLSAYIIGGLKCFSQQSVYTVAL